MTKNNMLNRVNVPRSRRSEFDVPGAAQRGLVTRGARFEPLSAQVVPTYDAMIEAAMVADEPLEVVERPLPALGQCWMVTLKNFPHIAVYVSTSKSMCEQVVRTRCLT